MGNTTSRHSQRFRSVRTARRADTGGVVAPAAQAGAATARFMAGLQGMSEARLALVEAVRAKVNAAGYDLDAEVARALESLLNPGPRS
ncbi:MAG: hypothetical protein KF754_08160 [Planctomycetes bacterium]|nr:hypothetical protein [Planctomycetota bacterium]